MSITRDVIKGTLKDLTGLRGPTGDLVKKWIKKVGNYVWNNFASYERTKRKANDEAIKRVLKNR